MIINGRMLILLLVSVGKGTIAEGKEIIKDVEVEDSRRSREVEFSGRQHWEFGSNAGTPRTRRSRKALVHKKIDFPIKRRVCLFQILKWVILRFKFYI